MLFRQAKRLGALVLMLAAQAAWASPPLAFLDERLESFERALAHCSGSLTTDAEAQQAFESYLLAAYGFDHQQITTAAARFGRTGIFRVPISNPDLLKLSFLSEIDAQNAVGVFRFDGMKTHWLRIEYPATRSMPSGFYSNPVNSDFLKSLRGLPLREWLIAALQGDVHSGFSSSTKLAAFSWPFEALPFYKESAQSRFVRFPSVFSANTVYLEHLLTALHARFDDKRDRRVLVMGSGTGIEAVALSKRAEIVVHATDINPIAVANTRANAVLNGATSRIKTWQSDLFSEVNERYDLILFNMPFAVSESEYDAQQRRNLQDEGARLLQRFIDQLPEKLTQTGRALVMATPSTWAFLEETSLQTTRIHDFRVDGSLFTIQEIRRK